MPIQGKTSSTGFIQAWQKDEPDTPIKCPCAQLGRVAEGLGNAPLGACLIKSPNHWIASYTSDKNVLVLPEQFADGEGSFDSAIVIGPVGGKVTFKLVVPATQSWSSLPNMEELEDVSKSPSP